MIFTTNNKANKNPPNIISFNNKSIEKVESFRYLGVIFDQNLNWKLHSKHVISKITPFVRVLSKLRYYLDKDSLMKIYYSHINSHLTYCLPVWQNVSQDLKSLIQRIQNKAIKLINFLPRLTPSHTLYNEKFLKFSHHITYENILFIHKVKNRSLKM